MITNAKQMGCGNCGHEQFRVYQTPDKELAVECCNCKSVSIVRASRPKSKSTGPMMPKAFCP